MLNLKKIDLGLVPYGPGYGQTAMALYFEQNTDSCDLEENVKSLVAQLTEELDKKNYITEWQRVLTCQIHLYWVGEIIMSPTAIDVIEGLQKSISHEAWKAQELVAVQSRKPPFQAWVGKPLHYTGMKDSYNWFNMCVALCPTDDNYSQVAMVEIKSHVFGVYHFTVETEKDLAVIDEYKIAKMLDLAPNKLFITSNEKMADKVSAFCIANNNRFSLSVEGKNNFLTFEA
jgi:hypothetical protein